MSDGGRPWWGVGRYRRLPLHHGAQGRLPCVDYGSRTPGEPAPPSPLHALAHRPHLFTMLTRAVVAMCMQESGAAAGAGVQWHCVRVLRPQGRCLGRQHRLETAPTSCWLWAEPAAVCVRRRPLLSFRREPGRDSGLWRCVRAEMRVLVCCGRACAGHASSAGVATAAIVQRRRKPIKNASRCRGGVRL